MDGKFALTPKGVRLMIIGLVVMIAGYILMCGPAVKDPAVFNYDMFDFRRIVLSPLLVILGIVIIIISIMRRPKGRDGERSAE